MDESSTSAVSPTMASLSNVHTHSQPTTYSGSVAAKKVAWAIGKMGASASLGPTIAPKATAFIEKLSSILQPYGITIHIEQDLFAKALPFLIFAGLVALHDYAKVRTGNKLL